MCWQCKHVKAEIDRLEKHLARLKQNLHGVVRTKGDRRPYWRQRYQDNQAEMLKAAKDRYHARKQNGQQHASENTQL
jgi:ElaB/YqjD/DUF883 family membrane-anchored ribosome-binding protein